MVGVIRVVWKELFELFEGVRGVAFVLVLPIFFLLLSGQLRMQQPKVQVLFGGVSNCSSEDRAKGAECRAKRLMEELSIIDLTTEEEREIDPLNRMLRDDFGLVINYNKVENDSELNPWSIFTAETYPARLATLSRIAGGIERALYRITEQKRGPEDQLSMSDSKPCVNSENIKAIEGSTKLDSMGENSEGNKEDLRKQATDLFEQIVAADALSPITLVSYYDQAANRSMSFFPLTIGLIICFMPFVLAAPSLIRERDTRTLEVLLAAPKVGSGSIFVGKTLAPVLVTLVLFLLMLVLLQSVYGIGVKAGILLAMLFLIPPILSSTFLGLLVSATLRSQSQTSIALFLYLLGLILLSGLFSPIEESSNWLQAFSKLIPLTFIPPSLNAWMYGAPAASKMAEALPWLVGQSLAFGALAFITYQRLLRRI